MATETRDTAISPVAATKDDGDNKIGPVSSSGFDEAEGEMKSIQHGKPIDPALAFIGLEKIEYSEEEGKGVVRKIDLYMLPLLMWVYVIQFADLTMRLSWAFVRTQTSTQIGRSTVGFRAYSMLDILHGSKCTPFIVFIGTFTTSSLKLTPILSSGFLPRICCPVYRSENTPASPSSAGELSSLATRLPTTTPRSWLCVSCSACLSQPSRPPLC